MKDYKSVFKELERNLTAGKWWDNHWSIYNRGVYMQVYRDNWFNENQGGIHFETYVEDRELEEKIVPIHMHAEDEFPKNEEFVRLFADRARPVISGWKGYKIQGTGYMVCQKKMPLDPRSLPSKLFEEFGRLQQLVPLIDQTIQDILA